MSARESKDEGERGESAGEGVGVVVNVVWGWVERRFRRKVRTSWRAFIGRL